ncbi:hypothetical protein O3P69_006578 [Scylla paramamosain]|uniref:Uncharacterized protein n=1 Tax=Scylla paramamosain TaxID=85552 RepID=A0AAW0U3D0_SCYPA
MVGYDGSSRRAVRGHLGIDSSRRVSGGGGATWLLSPWLGQAATVCPGRLSAAHPGSCVSRGPAGVRCVSSSLYCCPAPFTRLLFLSGRLRPVNYSACRVKRVGGRGREARRKTQWLQGVRALRSERPSPVYGRCRVLEPLRNTVRTVPGRGTLQLQIIKVMAGASSRRSLIPLPGILERQTQRPELTTCPGASHAQPCTTLHSFLQLNTASPPNLKVAGEQCSAARSLASVIEEV